MIHYLLLVIALFSINVFASYELTELEATALDVPDTSTVVSWDNTDTGFPDDDDKVVVNIGFNFTFDNTQYSQVRILTNGILQFGPDQRLHRDFRNEELPTDEGDRIIAVYWDDLVDDGSSSVTYGNAGTAPNRRFIVNWTNVRAYSNNLRYDFQVVLYENGDIRYRYNNNTANGQSATIGLEIDDSDSIQYSFNQISVETSFDLLFRNSLLVLPDPVASYRFDESSFDGTSGEVTDSSGNNLNGNTFNALNTQDALPAVPGVVGSCRYGEFSGASQYVEVPDNNLLDFQSSFTAAAWIKIDSIPPSGLKTILSKDENYEFHVNPSGQINWWWNNSSGSTRQINSSTTVTADVWPHVAVSYERGNQVIYINGTPSGTSAFNEDLRQNSDPLQIGSDQNFGGRYFNGDIDEVNIFNQFLTQNQVAELIDQTRPCASANLCVSSFPDGISTHSATGEITFGRDSQLFFSPDDRLNTLAVNIDGASSDRSCVAVECQANATPVPTTDAPSFPNTSSFTTDVTIPNSGTDAIGGVTNQYRTISVGNSAVMGTFTGQTDFYIDRLVTGSNSVLNLVAGNYWIRDLDLGNANTINVIGSGTVRLYVQTNTNINRDLLANSAAAGQARDASQLLIYAYGNLEFQRDATISGTVYSAGSLELNRDSFLYGAMAGASVVLGRDTNVYYLPSSVGNTDFGGLCQPASCTLGSFNISQPNYSLACPFSRATIQIQAMCDDGSTTKDDYAGTINLSSSEASQSQFYAASTGGSAINSVTLDGSESGVATVYLFHQNENNNLAVIASDTAASVSSTSTNETDFRTNGFTVTNAGNFVCGGSTSFSITAVGEDTSGTPCQVLEGFSGNKDFKAWFAAEYNPTNAGTELTTSAIIVNSTSVGNQTEPGSNNLTLNFANGVSNVSLQYPNTAQINSVNFKHDEPPYGTAPLPADLTGSVGPFVVSPARVDLAISTANSSCSSADGSCSAFVAAGSGFSVSATAQCSNGATATDYIGTTNLTHTLVAPAGGALGNLGVADQAINDSDNGTVTFTQSVSEVGVFNLVSTPLNYYGVAVASDTLSNVGRFIPASFAVTIEDNGSLAPFCNSATSFSYSGQDINWLIAPTLVFEARSTGGTATTNYTLTADFMKLANNDVSFQNLTADTTANRTDGTDIALTSTFNNGVITIDDATSGQVKYQLSSSDVFIYTKELLAQVAPFTPDLDIILDEVRDADNVTQSGVVPTIEPGGNQQIRFGRIFLKDTYGPEVVNLNMPLQTEYFSGSGYILNRDDSCTSYNSANASISGISSIIAGTGNLVSGESNIGLAAPTPNTGTGTVTYDAPAWLEGDYDGNGSFENPSATATFGVYRGHDRVIYWREVTN